MGSTRPSTRTKGSTRPRDSPTRRRYGSISSAHPSFKPIPDSYICPISKKIMIYPVSIDNDRDNHVYDLPCLIDKYGNGIEHDEVLNPRSIKPIHKLRDDIKGIVKYLNPRNRRYYENRFNIYKYNMGVWSPSNEHKRVNTNSIEFNIWHERYEDSCKRKTQ